MFGVLCLQLSEGSIGYWEVQPSYLLIPGLVEHVRQALGISMQGNIPAHASAYAPACDLLGLGMRSICSLNNECLAESHALQE